MFGTDLQDDTAGSPHEHSDSEDRHNRNPHVASLIRAMLARADPNAARKAVGTSYQRQIEVGKPGYKHAYLAGAISSMLRLSLAEQMPVSA